MSTTIAIPLETIDLIGRHALTETALARAMRERREARIALSLTLRSVIEAGLTWREERRAFLAAHAAHSATLIASANRYTRARYMGKI